MWTQYLLYLHVGFTAITFSNIKFDDSDLNYVDINTYNTATATEQKINIIQDLILSLFIAMDN